MKLSTRILPRATIDVIRRQPALYRALRSCLSIGRGVLPRIKYEGIPNRIHPNDFMLDSYSKEGLESYKKSGLWLMDQLEDVLQRSKISWRDIEGFLEIGCGYGRHTRWLAQMIPPNRITVADVTKEAVEYCVSEFGVNGVISDPNVDPEQFGEFTVIYAYSVLTHLSAPRIDNFFRLLDKGLLPGGVALFTLHGPRTFAVSGRIKSYLNSENIQREVDEKGIAFYNYPHYTDPGIGDTFVSNEYIKERMAALCPKAKVQSINAVTDRQDLWIVHCEGRQ